MNVYVGNRLPSTYQEVEYIQSSGTQWIDTGYVLTSNPGFDMDFEFVGGDSNSWIPICGSRNNSGAGTTTGNFGLYINSSSLYVTPNYAGFDPGASSGVTISKNTRYNIVENAGKFYLDGVYKSSASTTNTYVSNVARNFLIFAMNNYDGTVQIRGCQIKLYSFKLYNNNSLVRYLIPCYRKSDSAIGMYDLVNGAFYTNSGSGTFTKGSDVVLCELQNAYIGEDYSTWKILNSTLLYYPFEENNLDKTGNTSLSSGGTKQSLGYLFSGSSNITFTSSGESIFCSFWIKSNTTGTSGNTIIGPTDKGQMGYNQMHSGGFVNTVQFHDNDGWYKSGTLLTQSVWCHLAFGFNGTEAYVYKNGVKSIIKSTTTYVTSVNHKLVGINGSSYNFVISDWILDGVDREPEIINHFNATKDKYGL